ncbi:MAG: transporter ATP-binding protein [Deltaproteobacteria bacterium]|jgi:branched-chain amino acid transport system ATP-binding protein|nr:transporter ATP-binding protein [Deltaproteobacteria bacterium]
MSGDTWFRIHNLRIYYGRVEALKGISLGVDQGTIVTLIGANGAGKSTALRAISGLVRPASGEIVFQGKRIDAFSPQEVVRGGIAHVPEGRRVFPFMTVRENLNMGAFRRKDKEEIKKNLEGVFEHFPILRERRSQRAGSLSGGEQQMLAIGRALMSQPTLLLLDEPSLGLAPLMVREVGRIIGEINQRQVGIILVEQNARMALRIAHKGYVLETGSIVLQGPASDLIDNEHVKKAYLGG